MTEEGFFDRYVLVDNRRPGTVGGFLERYLPDRREQADEYEIPQHSRAPHSVFTSVNELLGFLSGHPTVPYGIYWNSLRSNDRKRAMAFFMVDNALILGLSVAAGQQHASAFLSDMEAYLDSANGALWFESPAPTSRVEFMRDRTEVTPGTCRHKGSGRPTTG